MKKFLIAGVLLSALSLAACGVNPQAGTRALEANGLTDIQLEGWSFFGCAEKDSFRTKFTAKNSKGETVSGVLCSGLFKGVTVRYW